MIAFVHRRYRRALTVVLLVGAAGCAQTFDASHLGVPVTMATPGSTPPEGAKFSITRKVVYGFWGLTPIVQPSLQRTLSNQLAGGTGVAGLKIKTRSRLSDIIMAAMTLGLIVPRTVTFEGVVTGGQPQQ